MVVMDKSKLSEDEQLTILRFFKHMDVSPIPKRGNLIGITLDVKQFIRAIECGAKRTRKRCKATQTNESEDECLSPSIFSKRFRLMKWLFTLCIVCWFEWRGPCFIYIYTEMEPSNKRLSLFSTHVKVFYLALVTFDMLISMIELFCALL